MLTYIVNKDDVHKPIACKELTYTALPRVGEKIIAYGELYEVTAVYHNLDLQEIKIVTEKVLTGDN